MRHCPECRRTFGRRPDVCPTCWCALVEGAPPEPEGLALVFETTAPFEADLVEGLLRDEGIPCLRRAARGALPTALAGLPALQGSQLFVRPDMAPLASELIAEVTGRAPRDR